FGADSAGNPATDLAQLVADPAKNAIGAFRLRIGDQYRPIVATERTDVQDGWFIDVGSTFDAAADLGSFKYAADPLTGQSWLISGRISPIYYDVQWPGGRNTPGNRDLPEGATDVWAESHTAPGDEGDIGPYGEIPTYYYNFQSVYGTIQNAPALNLITNVQKQRVREIFSIISQYSGVQFIESADLGMTIVTGDLRVFDPYIEVGPGAPAGMAGGGPENGLVIVNSYYDWGGSEYGSPFMQVMMHEILHPLGAMHSYELPAFEIMGSSETIATIGTDQEVTFPGNNDVTVLQYLYRNDSIDTDFYRFEIESEGDLSAETIAQRMQNASLLDTCLVLYDDQFQVIASNDDYFDDDSFIGVHLEAGAYYIGVSSTGNSQYGPDVDGGTTEGAYQLQLKFRPKVVQQLTDSRGTAIDGDADGVPGGQYDFWFNVQTASATAANNHTLIVDKLAPAAGADGTPAHPYKNISDALAAATLIYNSLPQTQIQQGAGVVVRVVGNNFANDNQGRGIQTVAGSLLVDGKTFTISDATRTFTFELDSNSSFTKGNIQVAFKATDNAAAIAAKLAAAINSVSWIPAGLGQTAPTRYYDGLYARATVSGTIVNVNGPTVAINLGSTKLKSTLQDNLAYEIGTNPLGNTLSDGKKLEVPQGVSLMIDAGAILKLRIANVSVGSSAVSVDRSLGALQVLGTPGNSVYFTSYLDERVGADTYANTTVPTAGNWGGLVFRNNYDYDEQAVNPNRIVLEQEGIFLNYVNHADIRYGGGKVTVNGIQDVYNPIHMLEARPTVSYSTIRYSADAAMSADPNSLLETTFHDGFGETPFAADYDRVGPDLHGNKLIANSLNALFLRVTTAAASALQQLDVSARFDDVDVVLAIPENIIITGDAGGAVAVKGTCPLTADGRNQLVVPGSYSQFVDRQYFFMGDGRNTVRFEFDLIGNGVASGSVRIALTLAPLDPADVATIIANAINGSILNVSASAVGDRVVLDGTNVEVRGLTGTKALMAGRLSIDPGAIVKLAGTRIETGVGAQFIAEGADGYEIIFTSLEDDTYGAGGTFDATNNGQTQTPGPGDWGGFYFNPTSRGSIDQARVFYAGGSTAIEGGFGNFAPIDIRQATVRVTNTLFQDNTAHTTAGNRNGRGVITDPAVIHVLFSQPVIAGNTFVDNQAPVVSIDVNSLNYLNVADWGRATGKAGAFAEYGDNQGPLVRANRMSGNSINGMIVRGGNLTTEGVWDDTDIVHVLYDEIVVSNLCTYGGLRLQSSADESLVVKLSGANAGLTATGRPLEIHDRIGGTIQVLGTPGHPVVFTDLADDTVGAGLTPDNRTVLDTDNTPNSTGTAGAWRSIKLEEYSNDHNLAILNEAEPATVASADPNASPESAEWLGQLAAENKGGDDVLRMGFEVHGTIALDRPDDVDVYSFQGYAGSEVWIQLDRTTFALDTVVELLDADGNVLARSDNWRDEVEDPNLLFGAALTLEGDDWGYEDVYSINPRDAGMRVVLPGPEGQQRTYYIRVSSAAPTAPDAHQTSGVYQLQVRLRKVYEHPGSTIRYADIRYATNGIEVIGLPGHSPLTSDIYETEAPDNPTVASNDTFNTAQALGNLLQSDRNVITVGGFLADYTDVDWYTFTVDYGDTIQRIDGFTTEGSVYPVTFDIDYADGLVRPDTTLWIFDETGTLILMGTDSGIVDDQPDPTAGTNLDDLTRGSVGARDPFIGPVYLLEGHTYYIAVTSTGATASATADDPMLRWEPINSMQRIAEDNIGSQNASGIGDSPAFELNPEPVPFHLGDVTFYVLTDGNVLTADPWTGVVETTYGALPDADPNANLYTYGDLVMLSDGRLYTVTRGTDALAADQNAAAGRLRELDTEDASLLVSDQDDGLITYRYSTDPANPPPALEVAGDNSPLGEAGGVHMEALVYSTELGGWLVVGNALNGFNEVAYQSNLLYLLLPDGTAIDPPNIANDGTARLPTNIIPIAQLATGPVIAAVDATHASDAAEDILDGTRFTVTDADGNEVTFELDCGPDIDMGTGALIVRDGMTFSVGTAALQRTFEFDGGPVMILGPDVGGSLEGQTFTITDNAGAATTFEFDPADDGVAAGNTAVTIIAGDTADVVAAAAVAAINGLGGVLQTARGEATLAEARVSLINDSLIVLPIGGGLLGVEGRYGLEDPASVNVIIPFEETWDDPVFQSILTVAPLSYPALFGNQIERVVELNLPAIDVSAADRTARNDRITFGGATVYDFAGMDPVWTHRLGFDHGGGAPLSEAGLQVPVGADMAVSFGAADTARQIALKIAAAINAAPFAVDATAEGVNVNLTYASLTDLPTTDHPLTTFGIGPGGKITGMAFLGDALYAVSDAGGFYEIVNYNEPEFRRWPDPSTDPPEVHTPNEIQPIPNPAAAHLRFIGEIESDQNPGDGVEFAGLTLGPQTVEEARYAETFFAVSRTGDLYALALGAGGNSVDKQGIFVDAQTSVTVPGMTAVSGLCFSTLDYNLWHVTERRADDDGHDVNATYDLSRAEPPPPERAELPNGGFSYYFGYEDAGNYNAPGGAYGSLVTQTFSLEQYSEIDAPTLYFEYFLDTGGPEGFDTAQVFASADGVTWYVLGATLDNPDGNLLDTNGQWHQTRIAPPEDPWQVGPTNAVYYWSLADFVGESEVRLRFDFTTAGDMNVGDVGNMLDTTGAYLQALAGDLIEDGDQLSVDGVLFEFDVGVALRLPNVAGDAIADGEWFEITDLFGGGSRTFEFVYSAGDADPGNEEILIEIGETTTEVAYRVAAAVNALGLTNSYGESIVADVYENRVMLNRAEGLEQSADPTIVAVGDGFRSDSLAATPIEITSMMTADEVAQVIGATFDAVFAGGNPSFRVQGSIIRMIHHPVDWPGPLPYANYLPGESGDFNDIARGQDNAHEGFYLDNIVIGFVERGEMATQVQANTDFVFTPTAPEKVISTGYYQLQVRGASEYAVWAPEYLYPMTLVRSFDTNDRFDESYTLTVPSANDIPQGMAFVVSDGVTAVTFQFLDQNVPSGNPDYEPIHFSVNESAAEVAAHVVEAINAAAAAGLFNVTATKNESSNRIDLFRAAKFSRLDDGQGGGGAGGGQTTLRDRRDDPMNFNGDTSAFMGLADATPTGDSYLITEDPQWDGVWYDAEKVPPDSAAPPGTGDDFLCWAAAASNILAWSGWGLVEGMYDADQVFQYFQDHWTDEGGWPEAGWEWWFTGFNPTSGWGGAEVDVPGGGFFRDLDFPSYLRTESNDALVLGAIDEFLHDGYGCTLGVFSDFGMAHAITVWGFNYDESDPDHYVGIWVTDSDDDKYLAVAPDRLRYFEVEWSQADGRWYMQDYYGMDTVYISDVSGLARRFTGVAATKYTELGDQNQVYDQGQIILENNKITYSNGIGILVAPAQRAGGVVIPKPGPTAPLAVVNGAHQVPGVVIQNNIVAYSGVMGINFGGDLPQNGQSIGSVPLGRIVNNTIYGVGTGTQNFGIWIGPNASPTMLNNVVANTWVGIVVNDLSTTTVVGTTAYSGNSFNAAYFDNVGTLTLGVTETFAIVIPAGEPLFVDAAAGNFYPAAGSRIIDSSLDSLQDRANMVNVKNPLGLPLSPILAPSTDILGQLRTDDPSVSPPSGFGQNTFKDRGAIDRVDFDGPTAFLVAPPDNDAAGIDRNPTPADVTVAVIGNQTFPEFIIRLQDDGAGIADYTVLPETVQVMRDGVELIEGRDYYFRYEETNDWIILRSAGGAWAPGSTYTIYLTDGIRDLADNPVQMNHSDDTTSFVIELIGYDFGDAPMSDTYLPDGARHIVDPDVHLGARIDSEATPQVDSAATADASDDGVDFVDGDYVVSQAGETKTIVVTASTNGVLDAWIDWNNDGVWDAGEKLVLRDAAGSAVTGILAGKNELTFDVPAGWAVSGDFYAFVRFRFSTTGLLSDGSAMQPTGEALDGEVEDYRIRVISTRVDWGDAPDPDYPTLGASNGASHVISTDVLCLGETVSLDPLPQPNLTATGDDDDGFDFSGVSLIPGRDADVSFMVANETGRQAYLSAWIDFNRDGDWSDAGEMIAGDVLVAVGLNTLTINVPDVAVDGDTFARFRLSTEQGLSFTGPAADGEVEDYRVSILPVPGEILGTKWNDLDGNGIRGLDETGLEGWTIYLDANGNGMLNVGELSTTTADDGTYAFVELTPGDYIVREVTQSGWQQHGPEYYNVTVGAGQIILGQDFFNQDVASPTAVSIELGGDNPTNADSVTFTVTFSEPVAGVDAGDFTLAIDGLTGAEVSGVSGSGAVYTVAVTTGSGEGTLRLDLVNDGSIQDLSGHLLGVPASGGTFEGEFYTIDRTPPMVVSIERDGDSPTNAETVTFIVTFGEAVAGVDVGDFDLVSDGLTGAAISEVTGADDVYTVTVTVGTGDGTLRLDLVDDDTIVDLAGNVLVGAGIDVGSFIGPVYEIDRTAPEVVSIARAGANPTSVSTLLYTVTFSEEVTGVNKSDFAIETNLTGASVQSVAGSGDTYTVAVLAGAGALGTVRLNLVDNDSIVDAAGNQLGGPDANNGNFEGEVYTIDRNRPTGLFLSNDRVAEHVPVNTPVGALSSTGPHAGAYAYQLVSGDGDDDNASFRVVGSLLRTNTVFDFDAQNTYLIRLRTTDSAGFWSEMEFTITVVAEEDTASIGDRVWKDNGNGLQDAGETAIAGATVEIFCSPSGVVGGTGDFSYGQTVTDAGGNYGFDLLLPDLDYYLVFRSPAGYTFTNANVGGDVDDTIDSDANSSGFTSLFTLGAGGVKDDLDAGLVGSAAAYDFAIRAGAAGDDVGQAVAADSAGNAYVAGTFRGTVDFDPGVGVYNLTSAGGSDVFVAKYSSSGALLWARAIGGTGDDAATGVAVVAAGSDDVVCVSGSFSATADFLSGSGVYNLTAAGGKDAFIAKLDSHGGLVWARGVGGAGDEAANDIALTTDDGSVYTTGYFATSTTGTNVDFDPDAGGIHNLKSIGPKDVFVLKLDYDGNFVWAKRVGGTGWSQGMSNGLGIATAADGSVYTTGSFQGVADFDPGPNQSTLTCAGDSDMFVSKLDAEGNFVWAKRVGGASEEYGADVAIASNGSVYLTGGFHGVVDFDPGAGTYNLNSAGNRRLFVLKLTSAGNFVWADGFGGTGWDLAGDIALDGDGGVYVTGGFYGIADFDPGAGTYNLTSAGQKDAFVLKLNSAGGFVGAQRTGGSGEDCAGGIAVFSPTGAVYTTGYFHGAVDFDPSAAIYQLNSAGGRDAFLAKYVSPAAAPLTVTIDRAATQADPTTASPIVFRVVFGAAVSDFTAADVTLGGTALGTLSAAVTPVGVDGTTYDVRVSGMTGSGDVTASIIAGMAHNTLGTPNQASTSTDNTVAYTYTAPAGPVISQVVVAEANPGSDLDGIKESSDRLVITWAVTSPAGVAARSL
ncbi:MAG: GEVED domain-containing protein, partial [Planctomycetales bacterium]|nr:GEVED domain-containing protein [Planctomycetales bacterium]